MSQRRSTFAGGRTLKDVQDIVKNDSSQIEAQIKHDRDELDKLRQTITVEIKQNMILDRDLKELDDTIKLHVRQKMSVRDILARSQNMKAIDRRDKDGGSSLGKTKKLYEDMFDLLQTEPHYVAQLARIASTVELPTFIQVVIFTLYGDQYEARLERLLLIMFDIMLDAEFASCDSMGTFMRANTAITQLLSGYCRRGQGMALLKDVLKDELTSIATDASLDFEINPMKIYQGLIKQEELETGKQSSLPRAATPDEAAAHPRVQQLVAERVQQLEAAVQRVFDRIVENVTNIPFGIRWISKRMREMCMEKWPGARMEEVNSIVGGLCFLRFFTPALTTPDALNIIDKPVSYRRNFILIAKVLQNLSNGVLFGQKEAFMSPMNSFLERASDKLAMFFDELCNVEALDDHMRMEIMYTMGKRDHFINITINDMFHMHALIDTYKDRLFGANPNDPLLALVDKLGPAPPKVKRELDYPVNLTMGLSGHQSSYDLSSDDTEEDVVYPALKERLVDMLRAHPPLKDEPADFYTILKRLKTEAAARKDFATAAAITEIIMDTGKLVGTKFESPEHVFWSLSRDITRNVDMQKKTARNLQSARKLLDDIRSARRDMEETLDIHLEYLRNVERQGKLVTSQEQAAIKKLKLPPKEFTHRELEEKRVIIESKLPLEVRKRVKFVISTQDCATFTVAAKFKMIPAFAVELALQDLLSKQENNEYELSVADEITLNVNLLMHLLNTHFIAKSEKLKMKYSK